MSVLYSIPKRTQDSDHVLLETEILIEERLYYNTRDIRHYARAIAIGRSLINNRAVGLRSRWRTLGRHGVRVYTFQVLIGTQDRIFLDIAIRLLNQGLNLVNLESEDAGAFLDELASLLNQRLLTILPDAWRYSADFILALQVTEKAARHTKSGQKDTIPVSPINLAHGAKQ
jgi:hypothetical protein